MFVVRNLRAVHTVVVVEVVAVKSTQASNVVAMVVVVPARTRNPTDLASRRDKRTELLDLAKRLKRQSVVEFSSGV